MVDDATVDVVDDATVDDTVESDTADVEVECVDVCTCKFNMIVPGPVKAILVELLEPEQVSPPEQLQ